MGTRGALGFRLEGKDYIAYNHWDSYPSGLGEEMAAFVRKARKNLASFKDRVSKLVLVQEEETPSPKQIKKLQKFADTKVSTGKLDEWYVLLRDCQGKPSTALVAGHMIDSHGFLRDSLFCEWAYVANFDTEKLEVYRGFQQHPHERGRYAKLEPEKTTGGIPQYYPVALLAEIPFAKVNGSTMGKVAKMAEKESEREEAMENEAKAKKNCPS